MSTNKRFFWLQLKEDFFDDDTIQWIEEQENGKDYVLFYLKLCLRSLKTEGKLMRLVGERLIPYDRKALAKLTNTDVDTVSVAMDLFTKIGLVQVYESGEIYLNQIEEMIGSETDKAAKMRRLRAERKLQLDSVYEADEGEGNNVTPLLQNVNESKSKRESKSIDKELQPEKEKRSSGGSVHRFYQENFGIEPPTIMEDLDYWVKDLSEELVIEALKKTVEAEKTYSYAKGIMRNWLKKNIRTLEQVKAEEVGRNRNRERSSLPEARKVGESYAGIEY